MGAVLKNVLAVVAAYAAMFATLFVLFSGMWAVIGADGAFRPDSWEVAGLWTAASIVLGFAAAVVGGWVCARLGANSHALFILMGLIIVLSILSAMPDAGTATGPRPPGVSMFDAMSQARQPAWLLWANPIVGIIGVWMVGRRLLGSAPK